MKLSRWQRNVLYSGLAACLVVFVFPPALVTYQELHYSQGAWRRSPDVTRVEREHRFVLDMPADARIDVGVLLLELIIIGIATALSVTAGASTVQSARRLGRTRALAPLVATLTRFSRHLVKADTRASLWGTIKRALTWWLPVWWGCTALALVWGHYREAAGMAVVGSVILSVAVVLVSLPFGLRRRKQSDAAHAAGWGRTKRIAAAVVFILFASGLALAGPVRRWADDMERQRHPITHHEQAPDRSMPDGEADLETRLARRQAQLDALTERRKKQGLGLAADEANANVVPDDLETRLARQQAQLDALTERRYARARRAREDMNLFSRGFLCGAYKAKAVCHGLIGMAASATDAYALESRSFERYHDNSREAETYE